MTAPFFQTDKITITTSTIPEAGQGVLAKELIADGTVLVVESPLMTCVMDDLQGEFAEHLAHVLDVYRAMSQDARSAYDALGAPEAPQETRSALLKAAINLAKRTEFSGTAHLFSLILHVYMRFVTNRFTLDATHGSVFNIASRFNHSCTPNAVVTWDATLRRVSVVAVENIFANSEIVISYLEDWKLEVGSERRLRLQGSYFFTCDCSACIESRTCRTALLMSPNDRTRQRLQHLVGLMEAAKNSCLCVPLPPTNDPWLPPMDGLERALRAETEIYWCLGSIFAPTPHLAKHHERLAIFNFTMGLSYYRQDKPEKARLNWLRSRQEWSHYRTLMLRVMGQYNSGCHTIENAGEDMFRTFDIPASAYAPAN